jgi:hypothetical protein
MIKYAQVFGHILKFYPGFSQNRLPKIVRNVSVSDLRIQTADLPDMKQEY